MYRLRVLLLWKKMYTMLPPRLIFGIAALLFSSLPPSALHAQENPLEQLRKLNQSVDALIKTVSPSVVQILVTGYGPLEESAHGNTNTIIARQRAIGS